MLLFSTATAVRGEGARMLLWSDLFIGSIRMDEVQRGLIVPVSQFSRWVYTSERNYSFLRYLVV